MCEHLADLLRTHQEAVGNFSRTLNTLAKFGPNISRLKYEQLAELVNEAHWKMEQARNELERHTNVHGCFPQIDAAGT